MFEGEKKIKKTIVAFPCVLDIFGAETNLLPSDQTLLQCCYLSFNDHIHGAGWAIC